MAHELLVAVQSECVLRMFAAITEYNAVSLGLNVLYPRALFRARRQKAESSKDMSTKCQRKNILTLVDSIEKTFPSHRMEIIDDK